MSREDHVRLCESGAVSFRRATRPCVESSFKSLRGDLISTTIYESREVARHEVFRPKVVLKHPRKTIGSQAVRVSTKPRSSTTTD